MHALHCSYSRSVSSSSLRNNQPHLSNICHKQTTADADTVSSTSEAGWRLSVGLADLGWKTTYCKILWLTGSFCLLLPTVESNTVSSYRFSSPKPWSVLCCSLYSLQLIPNWVRGVWLGLAYLHLSASAPFFRRRPAGFPATDVMVTSVILQTQPVTSRRQLRAHYQFGLKM